MSHRVTAFYHEFRKARLAADDLASGGFPAEKIVVAEGLTQGSGRVVVEARDRDQAIDVRAFLQQDGANSVEIHGGTDEGAADSTVPPIPAPQ